MLYVATVVYSSIALLGAAWLSAALLLVLFRARRPQSSSSLPSPPGPRPLPIIGNLHLLGAHESPFEAFTALSKRYGDVYSVVLGSTSCVVVNSFRHIKEVLITRGADFGGRPDFIRFHMLFGGDRNNCKYTTSTTVIFSYLKIINTLCHAKITFLQIIMLIMWLGKNW